MIQGNHPSPIETDVAGYENEPVEPPVAELDRDAMVGLMRRYRVAKRGR